MQASPTPKRSEVHKDGPHSLQGAIYYLRLRLWQCHFKASMVMLPKMQVWKLINVTTMTSLLLAWWSMTARFLLFHIEVQSGSTFLNIYSNSWRNKLIFLMKTTFLARRAPKSLALAIGKMWRVSALRPRKECTYLYVFCSLHQMHLPRFTHEDC